MYQDKNGDVIPALSTRGYLAVGVPGTVAGLELALGKYGTMKRKALMAPAIRLASKGFVLDQGDAEMLAEGAEDFAKDAPSAAVPQPGHTAGRSGWSRPIWAGCSHSIAARGPDASTRARPRSGSSVAASTRHTAGS
ncbi:MAG: gamma-glutamyltransferase [Novosphingobium sp.]